MSSAAKKLQEKLFAAAANGANSAGGSPDPGLHIDIPKHDSPSTLFPRKLARQPPSGDAFQHSDDDADKSDASSKSKGNLNGKKGVAVADEGELDDAADVGQENYKTYMSKLVNKLGTDYDGVEQYRLDQDARKVKHWKARPLPPNARP